MAELIQLPEILYCRYIMRLLDHFRSLDWLHKHVRLDKNYLIHMRGRQDELELAMVRLVLLIIYYVLFKRKKDLRAWWYPSAQVQIAFFGPFLQTVCSPHGLSTAQKSLDKHTISPGRAGVGHG